MSSNLDLCSGDMFSTLCVCARDRTFRDGVEVGFLAHGGQQWQSADVDPHLGVAVLLPGVILHHVEQTAD